MRSIAALPPFILSPPSDAVILSVSIITPKSLLSEAKTPVRLLFPTPFTPPIIVYIFILLPPHIPLYRRVGS